MQIHLLSVNILTTNRERKEGMFQTIIGTIIDGLYNDMSIDMVTIAKVGQYAENVYFGKPCGLMDQCACAVGGLISIDFKDTEHPVVNHVDVDFSK